MPVRPRRMHTSWRLLRTGHSAIATPSPRPARQSACRAPDHGITTNVSGCVERIRSACRGRWRHAPPCPTNRRSDGGPPLRRLIHAEWPANSQNAFTAVPDGRASASGRPCAVFPSPCAGCDRCWAAPWPVRPPGSPSSPKTSCMLFIAFSLATRVLGRPNSRDYDRNVNDNNAGDVNSSKNQWLYCSKQPVPRGIIVW